MKVTLIAVDLAKSVFQVCGVNQAGKPFFNRTVRRNKFLALLAQYPGTPVAMEACGGSNYWGRTLHALGHEVLLIPPQHVKPFVKGNKNDRNDAFAISEAARRPELTTVKPRSVQDTEVISVHRMRERLVGQRTALSNQIRGFLAEFGIVAGLGRSGLIDTVYQELESSENELTASMKSVFEDLLQELQDIEVRLSQVEKRIKLMSKSDDAKRLMTVKGIAEISATAICAYMGNPKNYRSGRHFSASLGLVPKEHSSGGKQSLGGITKRGNSYIRFLLVQGAWSILSHAAKSSDRLSQWALKLIERRGKHKAVVAVANKLARIAWAVLHNQTDYSPSPV